VEFFSVDAIESLNRKTTPFLMKVGEFIECQNIDVSTKIGAAKKTGDYTQEGNQITASKDILGLGVFKRAAGTFEFYVALNTDIYKLITATWTAQSQSLTASKGQFCSMPELDTLFYVNYTEATRSYAGSSWSTTTNVTSAPKARYVNTHQTRLFLGDCVVGATAYPTRYYFSSSGTGGSLSWDTTNDYYVLPEPITGFENNGETQLIFTRNFVFRGDAYDKHQIATVGTTSQNTVATRAGVSFFANDMGVFATDGATFDKISHAVDEYFEGMTKSFLPSMSAGILRDTYYIYIDDVTVEGVALTNVLLSYHIPTNKWSKIVLGTNCKQITPFTDGSDITDLYFGNDNGEIFKLFSGDFQDTKEFAAYLETPFYYPAGAGQISDFSQIEVWGNDLNGITVQYKTDYGENWESAGEVRGSYSGLQLPVKGSEKIAFRFSEMGKGVKFELHKFRIGYRKAYQNELS